MNHSCNHHSPPSSPTLFTIDGILDFLKKLGFRHTPGRKAIVETLFAAEKPLTIEELQSRATRIAKSKPDYATVFRLIDLLLSLKIVAKVNMQSSCSYFELRNPTKHYDHIICRNCHKVALLTLPCPVSETERFITENYGFRDLSHSLEFFGICPACSPQSPQSA